MLMSSAFYQTLLLASVASAITLQGKPELSKVMPYAFKNWTGNSGNIPDGKMWSMREKAGDSSSPWIIWATPDLRMTSPTPYLDDATAASPEKPIDIPNGKKVDGLNYAILPNDIPVPGPDVTGMRGDGQQYDEGLTLWIMSAFRLSETSQPDADPDALIGFEHNEDYYGNAGGGNCCYKSLAVRYSKDLGKSWTRSVPIITKGTQTPHCDEAHQFTGTGDFTAYWNAAESEWVIYAQNLVLSTSNDTLGKPGSWTKHEPKSGRTAPGFLSDEEDLAHGDLNDIDGDSFAGANPSILFDAKAKVYHMVWGQWGGGINHATSKDLKRWDPPTHIVTDDMVNKATYPTLFGNEGDTKSTDGMAVLLFTSNEEKAPPDPEGWVGRGIWEVQVSLS